MPSEQIHGREDGFIKVVVNYNPKSGEVLDTLGKTVVFWNDLKYISEFQGSPPMRNIPAPVRQSPLGDIIRLKEAGFTALDIIALKNSNTY